VQALNEFPATPLAGARDFSLGTTVGGALATAFGGDFQRRGAVRRSHRSRSARASAQRRRRERGCIPARSRP
jgi:hypothetical protein